VFPADGRTYLVGSFVSDADINSRSGVPFLSKVPVLKYLFSQKSTTRSRSYALLTLAVSVIPENLSSDEVWRRFGGAGSPTTASAVDPDAREQEPNSVSGILDQAVAQPNLQQPPPPQAP
jgi:type II secretory pathway component GspD/PulD (secretin)